MRPLTVDVVPNGIDLSAWPLTRRDPEPGRLRTISVMRLSPRKRPLALLRMLRAAEAAMPAGTKFSAVIVGDGPNAPAMRRYIRRHGLERFVTMAGHLPRPEIARRLARADIFVAPATLESFGIAALEACAAGVPVLGRAATGLADFVSDGSGGLLVGSDAAMVEALVDLSTGRRCVRPADRHTIEAMSWPSVVARTRALYARAGLACDAAETSTTKRWAS
jgi:glycosyltransferase involved in cell wall biosynthesis